MLPNSPRVIKQTGFPCGILLQEQLTCSQDMPDKRFNEATTSPYLQSRLNKLTICNCIYKIEKHITCIRMCNQTSNNKQQSRILG